MTFTDPLAKQALHATVDQLAVATKKLVNAQEEADKIPALQTKVDQLRGELITMVGKAGFTEEAIDLLLAAR